MATSEPRYPASSREIITALEEASQVLRTALDHTPDEGKEPDDMLRLWYPRGEAIVFGVWVDDGGEYENGDGEWYGDIEGWHLPGSPPWVEVVFREPGCRSILEAWASRTPEGYEQGMLLDALRRVTNKEPGSRLDRWRMLWDLEVELGKMTPEYRELVEEYHLYEQARARQREETQP